MKRSRPFQSPTDVVSALAADRENALALTPVSRETSQRLDRFVELLLNWQRTLHLIAPSTVPQLWTRHIADSLQLLTLAPQARVWIDLGSGGGFPGVVLACALAENSDSAVHLVESNTRKAAFLREASRVTGAPAHVHAERIEDFGERFSGPADAVTARALAPLNPLLTLAFPLLRRTGAVALFPKGQNAEQELGEAQKTWNIKVNMVPSLTDPAGRIVVVHGLEPRGRTP
jgi:16S rRNA (guanine527-N7)-methyltransferase